MKKTHAQYDRTRIVRLRDNETACGKRVGEDDIATGEPTCVPCRRRWSAGGLVPRESCGRCEAHDEVARGRTHAICRLKGIGYYDATKAEALARRLRRPPITISARKLRSMVSARAVYMPHTLHVNTRKYLVIGTYVERGKGERHFVLDGNHRAFIRSRTGKATKAYMLTLDETLSVFDGKRTPSGMTFVKT